MFYILVSRIPFVYTICDKKDKFFRTFLIGSICYIILHGLLYSKKLSENSLIEKYRNYLLHVASSDLVLTGIIIYMLDKKYEDTLIDVENSYVENGYTDEAEEQLESIEHQKMTRDEILQKYYQNQVIKNSPFINAEELKHKQEQILEPEQTKQTTPHNTEAIKEPSIVLISDTDIPLYQSST